PIHNELRIGSNVAVIGAAGPEGKPLLVNKTNAVLPAFFTIENGGALCIQNISFNGSLEGFGDVKAGIRSSSAPMNRSYKLIIDGCEFYNFNESTFSGFSASKGTYADELIVRNSLFRNISSNAIDLSSEKDDKGIYNAENVTIENCLFRNILG